MNKYIAIILAGGKSVRMGTNKAELILNGKSLLHHMQDILIQSGLRDIYISHPDYLPDLIPGYGPLSGIHASLNHIAHDNNTHLVFIPVDMPALTPSLLKRLIKAPSSLNLVCFSYKIMPFRLKADQQSYKFVQKILSEKKDVSLNAFLSLISPSAKLKIKNNEKKQFQNINTYQEWVSFKSEKKACLP